MWRNYDFIHTLIKSNRITVDVNVLCNKWKCSRIFVYNNSNNNLNDKYKLLYSNKSTGIRWRNFIVFFFFYSERKTYLALKKKMITNQLYRLYNVEFLKVLHLLQNYKKTCCNIYKLQKNDYWELLHSFYDSLNFWRLIVKNICFHFSWLHQKKIPWEILV